MLCAHNRHAQQKNESVFSAFHINSSYKPRFVCCINTQKVSLKYETTTMWVLAHTTTGKKFSGLFPKIVWCCQFEWMLNSIKHFAPNAWLYQKLSIYLSFTCFVGRRFYILTESGKYTVGRRECNLLIRNDTSVSRSHAVIYRSSSGVRIKDPASTYGTFLNGDIEKNKAIEKKTLVNMKVGETVRFGRLENTYRLEKIKVKVCTSVLPADAYEKLLKQLKAIDGELLNKWSTECTHLVMTSVSVNKETICIKMRLPMFFDLMGVFQFLSFLVHSKGPAVTGPWCAHRFAWIFRCIYQMCTRTQSATAKC